MNSGQRSRIGFIGSIVTHIFILLFVSFVGLFNLSHPPANDIVEVSLFGGGGGGGGNDADKRAGDLRAPFLRPDEHDGDDQRADEDGLEVRVEAEAGVGGELFEVGAAL